jgi:hypothetical protein
VVTANANISTVITNICAVAFTRFSCMVAARVMYPSLKKIDITNIRITQYKKINQKKSMSDSKSVS